MKPAYDFAVIGGGPSGFAVLSSLPESAAILMVNGSSKASELVDLTSVHPKIRAVASERKENVGVRNALKFQNLPDGLLSTTAALGGLSNYWGQQFIEYLEGDEWPRNLFADHQSYSACCSKIKSTFHCLPTAKKTQATRIEKYEASKPQLLLGTKERTEAGLFSMQDAILNLVSRHGADMVGDSVVKFLNYGNGVELQLSNGRKVYASRVFIAAGVIGTLRLVMNSCESVSSVRLSDHSPKLLYFLNRSSEIRNFLSAEKQHFNALTIERKEQGKSKLFASFYKMSLASVGLTLASLGFQPRFAHLHPPKITNIITPVQVWTEKSYVSYQFECTSQFARVVQKVDEGIDEELLDFQEWLREKGFVLHCSDTASGFGFHYHDAQVSDDGIKFQKLDEFISQNFNFRVIIADPSVLERIGVRPHTLTAMAAASELARINI